MSNAVQVAKIVEAALAGDLHKVRSYAALAAQHFELDGDARSARIIRRSYGAESPGLPCVLDIPVKEKQAIMGFAETWTGPEFMLPAGLTALVDPADAAAQATQEAAAVKALEDAGIQDYK